MLGIAALNHIKITMEYALQNITISYDKIKYLMTKNEDFIYFVNIEEIFNCYYVT